MDSLLIQLQPEVTEKWYQFGKAIGVGGTTLDKYASYPPEQNMIEVCDYWLRNHTGQPTWNEVAAALRQIGFQQLARDIENIYETGSCLVPYSLKFSRGKYFAFLPNSAQKQIFTNKISPSSFTHALNQQ